MPATQQKIITRLLERWQIEADLRDLLAADSEMEFRRRAQKVASLGSPVLPVLVDTLERADARMLAALGTVAASLDHDEVTRVLRDVVLQPQSSDRIRMGAMAILERFLGEPPDDHLLAGLANPERAAISALDEVLDQAGHNPGRLVNYIEGLDRQEPDVVLAVVQALRQMGTVRAVEPLRMMAQDVRDEIAAASLQALGAIRLPEAATALQTLVPITGPELQSQAARLLRKLQFSGVEVGPLPGPSPHWRALVGAVDGLGQQQVWFIQDNQVARHTRFLNVLVSDRAGAVQAVGHVQVPSAMLPPRRPSGYVHDLALPDGSGALLMLEAPFERGRRIVADALATNRETQIPVAGPLRLLGPWLWGVGGADPPRDLPVFSAEDRLGGGRLIFHPAFASWTVHGEAILRAAEEALRHPKWDQELWVRRLVGELLAEPAVRQVLSRRLLVMSEWLLLAGEESGARLAAASGEAIQRGNPEDQPFLRAIVHRDLVAAIERLGHQVGS